MTVIVPHHKTKQEVIDLIDKGVTELFGGAVGKQVEIVNPQKSWTDSTMTFSLTGKLGFIEVPLSGTAVVDDQNVTVNCDLPPMVKNFLGEAKVQAGIEKQFQKLLA